jgi:hypothetical protein
MLEYQRGHLLEQPWDPTILDHTTNLQDDSWYADGSTNTYDSGFDDVGNYRFCDALSPFAANNVKVNTATPNTATLRPLFAWATADIIQHTLDQTTQYGRSLHLYGEMRKHFKSRFPAFNVIRRNEPVATDTVYSDTVAIAGRYKCAQVFVGRHSLILDVYGMRTDGDFASTLEDNIRKRGAMDLLISDRAQAEISDKVKDILRALFIDDWQSEPHHQHQNFAERKYAELKTRTNLVLNKTGAPANTWLLCMQYIAYVLNRTSVRSLQWKTPLEMLTGSTTDISPMLHFHFWEPVFFTKVDSSFPSESTEEKGNFVGIAESVGDAMTFKVISKESNRLLYRSNVRSSKISENQNLRLIKDEDKSIIWSKQDDNNTEPSTTPVMPGFDPSSLLGRTFLHIDEENSDKQDRMKIIKMIAKHQDDIDKQPEKVKFLVENDDGTINQILSYNEIISHLEKHELSSDIEDGYSQFKRICGHQGPLKVKDAPHKGCKYNLEIEWEDGDITFERLDYIGADDPVSVAKYAQANDLFDIPAFKKYKKYVELNKVFRLKLQTSITCLSKKIMEMKYRYFIPSNHAEAMMLDKQNGNTKWQDAEKAEIDSMSAYNVFKDVGANMRPSSEYTKIRVHMIYDVKHDGRHKARLVAGGHLTPIPLESIYSGVVSLKGLRIVTFLSELNQLPLWGADITSAYLEALTDEKVYFIAGPEFGPLCGHIMVIFKALYGLRSSGLRWHERFADVLRMMDFEPNKADPDIWFRRNGDKYEYIAVYVDDLAIVAVDPLSIINQLKDRFKFQLKGVGPLEYHLGCDFFRNVDNTLSYGPKKYIKKMLESFEQMFGQKPNEYKSPLLPNDHPEFDTSDLLDEAGINQYQSMIGAAQWAITLGRFDIQTAIMTMSQFRVAPRIGHLDRMKRIYGYLKRFSNGAIRINTSLPDFSNYQVVEYDWSTAVYGDVSEDIAPDIPTPLGKKVILSHYFDANLYHDLTTGRAVTGILHFLNRTPIDWYSKRQATVETATYGSEFVAARITVDQIIDLRTTLRYLGVPIEDKSFMFGDNNAVIISSSLPHSTLKKRHNALSYHRVREAIAAKIIVLLKIHGTINFGDLLSKHFGYQQAWPLIQPLLFWHEYGKNWKDKLPQKNGECQTDITSTATNQTAAKNTNG